MIIVVEWPLQGIRLLGSRNPGVDSILLILWKISRATAAYEGSPLALAYSAIAIAAKVSEKT